MITTTRPRRTGWQTICYLAGRALRMEIGVWQSLYRFVLRRPRVPAGAVGFGYHQPVLSILIVFVSLSAVEIVVLDVIVHRWPVVRLPLLIAGIWGLTWMLGLLFGYLTRPHAVGPDGLRIRHGSEIDIPITWDVVDFVALRKHRAESDKARLTTADDGTLTWGDGRSYEGGEPCHELVRCFEEVAGVTGPVRGGCVDVELKDSSDVGGSFDEGGFYAATVLVDLVDDLAR